MSDIRNILAMHAAEDLRDRLAEDALKRMERKSLFDDLVIHLRRIDPNWERWYDECVPEWSDWLNAPIALIDARIQEILQEGECTCKPDAAQDCPACRSRRDSFATHCGDYENV